jgi:carboxylesterase
MTARTLEPFDPDVVAPWVIGDGRRGALLLHGFAGTPPELRGLGERLAAAGWRCSGPAMAGHARTPEDLSRTTWQDWVASAQAALDELAATCDQVVVAGQSTGGTVALHLAATDLRVAAVATLAAPVWLSGVLQRTLPVAKHIVRWNEPGRDVDLYRLEGIEELWSYGRRSTRAIHELVRLCSVVRDELAQVRAPAIICHGERDRVIDPRNALEIETRLLCSRATRRLMYPRSGHGMSVDIDRDALFGQVCDWFEEHVPRAAAQASSPSA